MTDNEGAREKRQAEELASGRWSAASVRGFKRWDTRSEMPDTRSQEWADYMTWLAEELPGSEFHRREQAQLHSPPERLVPGDSAFAKLLNQILDCTTDDAQ